MRRGLLLAVLLALTVAVPAVAHPVSIHRAKAEIRADKLDFPTSPHVDWCARKRFGTICGVSVSDCYVDATFGPASIVFRNLIWVSRTRGKFNVATVGWPPVIVTAPPPPGQCGQFP